MPVVYIRPDVFQLRIEPTPVASPFESFPSGPSPAARTARLEIEALQALLTSLPPDQAGALKAEAAARIEHLARQLGLTVPAPGLIPETE